MKVRAGIRVSLGIRDPNWFQLSIHSNDHVFGCTDGAMAYTFQEAVVALFPPASLLLWN